MAGVIAATIATTLLICDIVEPYVVFRHVFGKFPGSFYVRSYAYTGVFTAALLVMSRIMTGLQDQWTGIPGILVCGSLSILLALTVLGLLALIDRGFRRESKALAGAGIVLIVQKSNRTTDAMS